MSDGSRSYQAAIAQYLPDARHVLDRFHVVRWFTQGLTLVRGEIQRRSEGQAAQWALWIQSFSIHLSIASACSGHSP